MSRQRQWLLGLGGVAAWGCMVWLTGCGGASGPSWSTNAPSYNSYNGNTTLGGTRATVPAAAGIVIGVVEVPGHDGSAPQAGAAPRPGTASVERRPLAGAQVHLIDRATKESVSATVTTDARGAFRIENVTPSTRFSVVAAEGKTSLEAVIPSGDPGNREVRVVLNEATTIGAEAARLVGAEGLGPEAEVSLAQQVTALQEAAQAEHPAEVPDLTRADDRVEHARRHLLRTADAAVGAALAAKEKPEAWRALASAQLLARDRWDLSRKVCLTPLQSEALVNALLGKETRAVAAEKIAAALVKAGVKAKEGKPVTPALVGDALDALRQPLPSLKDVNPDQIPVLAALLLAEQQDGAFRVATREQLKVFLKELVGEVEAIPAGKSKTTKTAKK